MRISFLFAIAPIAIVLILIQHEVKSDSRKNMFNDTDKFTEKDIEELRKELEQTPAEDRVFVLKKLIKLGALGAILATPALAAALIPLKLIPILFLLKNLPPVNIVPLPPPPPPVYYDAPPAYEPPPPVYNPPAPPPPVYSPPAAPPVYSPPAAPPVYSPPAAPPVYSPPAAPPVYSPPAAPPPLPAYEAPPYTPAQSYNQPQGY